MSLRPVKSIRAIHANDPEWIIQLWFAIHGGDPAPELISAAQIQKAAAGVIRSLAVHLEGPQQKAVMAAIEH